MDGLSACMIDTRLVCGFQGAGKTFYICDCIRNDYFYKYGTTLVLSFEKGEEKYDEKSLSERNAHAVYYDGRRDIEGFCLDQIREYHPDRIYVEMNAGLPRIRKQLPEIMNVTSTVTWIDWSSLDLYFVNNRQMLSQMVAWSQQVTFRGCPSKDLLAPYSQDFKLMNHRASYLRQDPLGYHEKAFDLFVPYSLDAEIITINAGNYLIFWLDAADHPEHYDGKHLCFSDPLELRCSGDGNCVSAGRVVMTCCMADLQFMSFELTGTDLSALQGGWITMEAHGRISEDEFRRKVLKLVPGSVENAAAPKSGILLQGNRTLSGTARSVPSAIFRRSSGTEK